MQGEPRDRKQDSEKVSCQPQNAKQESDEKKRNLFLDARTFIR